jgi:hypothetical protein
MPSRSTGSISVKQAREHRQQALTTLAGLGIDHTDDEDSTMATVRTQLVLLDQVNCGAGELAGGGRLQIGQQFYLAGQYLGEDAPGHRQQLGDLRAGHRVVHG